MGGSSRFVELDWLKNVNPEGNVRAIQHQIPNLICVSEKHHKVDAFTAGLDGLKINATIGHMPVSRIDEPYGTKAFSPFMRQKSEAAADEFKLDYPNVIELLNYIKELELNLLTIDVRRKIGIQSETLTEMHKPPEAEYTERTIADYIYRRFKHLGTNNIVERIQTGFDVAKLSRGKNGRKVKATFHVQPVVSEILMNWDYGNPLCTPENVEEYVAFTRHGVGNEHNQKNLKAPGGVLNEWLILYALLSGTAVDVTYHPSLKTRLENAKTKKALEVFFTPGLIRTLEEAVGKIDKGSQQQWWSDVLLAVTSTRDHALGGPWDAIAAITGQTLATLECCDDDNPVELPSHDYHIVIPPVRHTFDQKLLKHIR